MFSNNLKHYEVGELATLLKACRIIMCLVIHIRQELYSWPFKIRYIFLLPYTYIRMPLYQDIFGSPSLSSVWSNRIVLIVTSNFTLDQATRYPSSVLFYFTCLLFSSRKCINLAKRFASFLLANSCQFSHNLSSYDIYNNGQPATSKTTP